MVNIHILSLCKHSVTTLPSSIGAAVSVFLFSTVLTLFSSMHKVLRNNVEHALIDSLFTLVNSQLLLFPPSTFLALVLSLGCCDTRDAIRLSYRNIPNDIFKQCGFINFWFTFFSTPSIPAFTAFFLLFFCQISGALFLFFASRTVGWEASVPISVGYINLLTFSFPP